MYYQYWWQNFLEKAVFLKKDMSFFSWSSLLISATPDKKASAKKEKSSSEESSSDEEEAKPGTVKKGINIPDFSDVWLPLVAQLSWKSRIFEK